MKRKYKFDQVVYLAGSRNNYVDLKAEVLAVRVEAHLPGGGTRWNIYLDWVPIGTVESMIYQPYISTVSAAKNSIKKKGWVIKGGNYRLKHSTLKDACLQILTDRERSKAIQQL